MRYLFIDTETTGLPLNWDAPHTQLHAWPRIVSIIRGVALNLSH